MTDKERLDYLQKNMTGYGFGWILRISSTGRGLRLHETTQEDAVPDIRKAIDNYIKENTPIVYNNEQKAYLHHAFNTLVKPILDKEKENK